MSKSPINPFAGKPRPAEPERATDPAQPAPAQRPYQAAPQRIADQQTPALRTILGQGCVVEGKLVCSGPTQLDGKVTGELIADDFLIIDRNAAVLADLNVQEVVVRGVVKGNIRATKRVTLEESAQVEGDVAAPAVEMKIGAQMSGKIDVIHRAKESSAAADSAQGYQAHATPATQPYREHPMPRSQAAAPASPPASREPAPAFVAFDDGAERSGF